MQIIANAPAGSRPPAPALKEDGSLYRYRMHFDGGARIAFADDEAELVSIFIPGYLSKDEDSRLAARLDYGISLRTSTAAQVLSNINKEISSRDYALLSSDSPAEETESGLWFWDNEIPLVILAQDYEPYTSVSRPLSSYGDTAQVPNLIVIDILTDTRLLESLQAVGLIHLSEQFVSNPLS